MTTPIDIPDASVLEERLAAHINRETLIARPWPAAETAVDVVFPADERP